MRPPFANFYRAALGAVDRASQKLHRPQVCASSRRPSSASFVDTMRQNKIEGWQGPGGSFVYMCCAPMPSMSSTAPMEGYAGLGIPYMAHIVPTKRW